MELINADDSTSEQSFNENKIKIIFLNIGLFLCIFTGIFFKYVSTWINLRTALRLRTACIASVYFNAIKSSVAYQIAPHQVSIICLLSNYY